jgi:hypothetical protein
MFVCGRVAIETHFQALSYSNQFRHVVINLFIVLEEYSSSRSGNRISGYGITFITISGHVKYTVIVYRRMRTGKFSSKQKFR